MSLFFMFLMGCLILSWDCSFFLSCIKVCLNYLNTSRKKIFIVGFERSLSSDLESMLTQEILNQKSVKQPTSRNSSPRLLRLANRHGALLKIENRRNTMLVWCQNRRGAEHHKVWDFLDHFQTQDTKSRFSSIVVNR